MGETLQCTKLGKVSSSSLGAVGLRVNRREKELQRFGETLQCTELGRVRVRHRVRVRVRG